MTLRIAHISDLHFSKISFNPLQFFSKRWLGMVNLVFFRRKTHWDEQVYQLIPQLKKQGITHVIISGDLTTTSLKREMRIAKKYTEALEKEGLKVFLIPGNHDHYTKRSCKKRIFYHYFPSQYKTLPELASYNLKDHGVTTALLEEPYLLVLVDSTEASPWTFSTGHFKESTEENLKKVLGLIPPSYSVIMVNHFPFFNHDSERRKLHRGDALRKVLEAFSSNVRLYLHGHTHRHTIADLRPSHLPVILDSGSVSYRHHGTWNLLNLKKDSCVVQAFSSSQSRHKHDVDIQPFITKTFEW